MIELKLKNFKCFEKKTFTFDDEMILVSAPSGSGKTTILAAIKFAIWGSKKSSSIVKIDGNEIMHGKSSCMVELNYKMNGTHLMITRSKRPNRLVLKVLVECFNKEITDPLTSLTTPLFITTLSYEDQDAQSRIDDYFGSQAQNTYTGTISGTGNFVDCSPSDKLEYLEKMANTENINLLKLNVKEKIKIVNDEMKRLDGQLIITKQLLQSLESEQIEEVSRPVVPNRRIKSSSCSFVYKDRIELTKEIESVKKQISDLKQQRMEVQLLNSQFESFNMQKEECGQRINNIADKIEVQKQTKQKLRNEFLFTPSFLQNGPPSVHSLPDEKDIKSAFETVQSSLAKLKTHKTNLIVNQTKIAAMTEELLNLQQTLADNEQYQQDIQTSSTNTYQQDILHDPQFSSDSDNDILMDEEMLIKSISGCKDMIKLMRGQIVNDSILESKINALSKAKSNVVQDISKLKLDPNIEQKRETLDNLQKKLDTINLLSGKMDYIENILEEMKDEKTSLVTSMEQISIEKYVMNTDIENSSHLEESHIEDSFHLESSEVSAENIALNSNVSPFAQHSFHLEESSEVSAENISYTHSLIQKFKGAYAEINNALLSIFSPKHHIYEQLEMGCFQDAIHILNGVIQDNMGNNLRCPSCLSALLFDDGKLAVKKEVADISLASKIVSDIEIIKSMVWQLNKMDVFKILSKNINGEHTHVSIEIKGTPKVIKPLIPKDIPLYEERLIQIKKYRELLNEIQILDIETDKQKALLSGAWDEIVVIIDIDSSDVDIQEFQKKFAATKPKDVVNGPRNFVEEMIRCLQKIVAEYEANKITLERYNEKLHKYLDEETILMAERTEKGGIWEKPPTNEEICQLELLMNDLEKKLKIKQTSAIYTDQLTHLKRQATITSDRVNAVNESIEILGACACAGTGAGTGVQEEIEKEILRVDIEISQESLLLEKLRDDTLRRQEFDKCNSCINELQVLLENHYSSMSGYEAKMFCLSEKLNELNRNGVNCVNNFEEKLNSLISYAEQLSTACDHEKQFELDQSAYNDYLKRKDKHVSSLNNYKTLIDGFQNQETVFNKKYTATLLLKSKIAEAQALALSSLVDTINVSVQTFLDLFFEEPMVINLSVFKSSIKDEDKKPKITINLYYKGVLCPHDLSSLSSGEYARVSLSFTLAFHQMNNNKFTPLMLDERTANLDQDLSTLIYSVIKETFGSQLILVVAHQVITGPFDNVMLL
jgi:ABC-type lipoprotein export system ATPase subunit